jgi:hypothetical protein
MSLLAAAVRPLQALPKALIGWDCCEKGDQLVWS